MSFLIIWIGDMIQIMSPFSPFFKLKKRHIKLVERKELQDVIIASNRSPFVPHNTIRISLVSTGSSPKSIFKRYTLPNISYDRLTAINPERINSYYHRPTDLS